MKHSLILFSLICTCSIMSGQRKADIGLTGGTSYYQGDINPTLLFYNPRYNIGPILRFNINKRYSIRFHAIYANVSGSKNDFYFYQENIPNQRLQDVNFNNQFVNIASQLEYNFFNYESGINPGDWTPYMFGGLGYSVIFSPSVGENQTTPTSHFAFPFGLGTKMNLTRRMSAGLQWSYNKTFNDNFDGIATPMSGPKINNNDWYSFFNLFITYKFFKFAADCPAYH